MATVAVPQPISISSHDISHVHNRLSCGVSTAANKLRLIRCLSDQNVRNKLIVHTGPNSARAATEKDVISMDKIKPLRKKEKKDAVPILPVARARALIQCNFGHLSDPDYVINVNTLFPYPEEEENVVIPPAGQVITLENGEKAISVHMSCCAECLARALREHFWVRCVYLFRRRCDCCHQEFDFDNLGERVNLIAIGRQVCFMHAACAEMMGMRTDIPQGGDVA